MYYIGLMSGTSMDAVDAALVEFDKKAVVRLYKEYPLEASVKKQIRQINEKSNLIDVATLDNKLGYIFADAANDLIKLANINPNQVAAIGSHGQTVLHVPTIKEKTSIQISDPNIICAQTGIVTVADFRRMDMAFGGEGAPLASAFHEYQFKERNKSIAILNIGGFANVTLLPCDKNKIIGFDTGPGNALLDDWIRQNKNIEYDKEGIWANSGKVDSELLELLLKDDYFSLSMPKSTGREYFNLEWLKANLDKLNKELSAETIQATLLKLTAVTITDAIKKYADGMTKVLICGGGVNNLLLIKKIQKLLAGIEVTTTSEYGLPPDCIEAVAFAWLAKKRLDNKSTNVPDVTGANRNTLLGGVYAPNKEKN